MRYTTIYRLLVLGIKLIDHIHDYTYRPLLVIYCKIIQMKTINRYTSYIYVSSILYTIDSIRYHTVHYRYTLLSSYTILYYVVSIYTIDSIEVILYTR